MAESLRRRSGPAAESDGLELGVQRAQRQARLRVQRVVARRGDVVRRVGVEERREVLDLAAPDAELVLPAAVRAHPALLAEVVRVEQGADAPEARRLEVDG